MPGTRPTRRAAGLGRRARTWRPSPAIFRSSPSSPFSTSSLSSLKYQHLHHYILIIIVIPIVTILTIITTTPIPTISNPPGHHPVSRRPRGQVPRVLHLSGQPLRRPLQPKVVQAGRKLPAKLHSFSTKIHVLPIIQHLALQVVDIAWFVLHFHVQSEQDIKLALASGYPEELAYKLYQRRAKIQTVFKVIPLTSTLLPLGPPPAS